MKIEKLNENKIRVIFNREDLQENNIDIHSFMSNSIESQNIFLIILDKAEREVGFYTDNYKLSIEAIALINELIYKFSNYDDLISLENFLATSDEKLFNEFSNSYLLYEYNDYIFLILEVFDNKKLMKLTNIISEFAIQIENSELVIEKISEFGKKWGREQY